MRVFFGPTHVSYAAMKDSPRSVFSGWNADTLIAFIPRELVLMGLVVSMGLVLMDPVLISLVMMGS